MPQVALRLLPLAGQSIVLGVRPDPEPHNVCFVLHGKRPVMQTNPHRPETPNFLEVQGGMPRVLQ
jgi:hypothetical protein